MDEYLGTIVKFPYYFSPKHWLVCHGQILSLRQNQALFSLLGTTYGGNGVEYFAIPDLRVKNARGEYYRQGEIMADGTHYIESYINISGIYPSRD